MDWGALGITWGGVGLVVAAGLGIYAFVVLAVRVIGQRSLGNFSAFDLAVTVGMGSIVGRVVLVRTTLAAGVVGLSTLFAGQAVVRALRARTPLGRVFDHPPVLLARSGRLLEEGLHGAHLQPRDVYEQIRANGLGDVTDVEAAVLERDGSISIVPRGTSIAEDAFADVPAWTPPPRSGTTSSGR